VSLHIRDYLVGATSSTGNPPHDDDEDEDGGGVGAVDEVVDNEVTRGRGRKSCSHCGRVFYGEAPIVRAYPRTLRTARYVRPSVRSLDGQLASHTPAPCAGTERACDSWGCTARSRAGACAA
jgi:hypothetical protein